MATKIPAICKTPAAQAIQRARWALSPEHIQRRDAVLDFWFGAGAWRPNPETPDVLPEVKGNFGLWFGGGEAIDKEITDKFKTDVEKAIRGEYLSWQNESPHSLLALIILLDQFPMNIYRDKPEGYLASELAIPLAYTALGRGWVEKVSKEMRIFFTLPLMHSELIDDQTVLKNMQPDDCCVEMHYKVVAAYGRLAGRNKVMGRKSTEEEEEYLKNDGVF